MIDSQYDAVKLVERMLGFGVWSEARNRGLHTLLRCKGKRLWVAFKREIGFMSFAKIFPAEKGMGESLNKEVLDEALREGVDLFLFVYPDSKIYSISVVDFAEYVRGHRTVRTTEAGEVTASVPFSMLERWLGV